ncbi:MAG: molybdenum cofactor biosynthesis protein MoaE [Melioribacter sp.]|uniref:molybdenum cofactor biosynthesis protein MoaE n=1 Tax=Rosettibacter primus TaxID=3111523 RepID=UPI00247D01FA|nr:molybdenum cofactor biosynthesis protein MoaE [Melioribacter sp.]
MQYLSKKKIDINKIVSDAANFKGGAVVIFCGKIRQNNKNKTVKYILYESYISMAEKMIKNILESAITKWNLLHANAIHRMGKVNVNEVAVIVITQHEHRSEAYMANQYIIDKIKHEVPIWKCEYYNDGTYMWSPNP